MKRSPIVYLCLLGISLIVFLLEVFIVKFDGVIGLTICIISTYLIVGSIIRLIRLTNIIDENIMEKFDILFF